MKPPLTDMNMLGSLVAIELLTKDVVKGLFNDHMIHPLKKCNHLSKNRQKNPLKIKSSVRIVSYLFVHHLTV